MAGTLTISTLSDGTNSTSATNCIQGSAKAWVSYVGNNNGTILASYNVSSITLNSNNIYTINFTNALSDANYCFVGGVVTDSNSAMENVQGYAGGTRTTSAFQVAVRFEQGSSTGQAGASPVYCAFFR